MLPGVNTAGTEELVEQWRGLMARHAAVSCALGQELGDRHGIGVHEFEVLERLAASERGQCRIQELSESVSLSQSALSRLVARRVIAKTNRQIAAKSTVWTSATGSCPVPATL